MPVRLLWQSLLIYAVQSALFWRTDEDFNVDIWTMVRHAEGAIIHATERNQPREDIELVEKALAHL